MFFLLIGVFVFFFMLDYLPEIVGILQNFGINSRTLIYFSEGIITSDSGRGEIYDVVIEEIKQNPLFGYGLFADRVFVGGVYCHNIFLEMFVDFGVLIPSLLVILFVGYYWKILSVASSKEIQFFILLFLASIIPLLLSGSYLTDFKFPLFVGYAYAMGEKYWPVRMGIWQKK